MKVVCCTITSDCRKGLFDIFYPNLEKYAATHGYDTFIIRVQDGEWEYKKHEAFKLFFESGYDLIWYRDDDSLITNMTIPITQFIDDYYSFYLTKDFTEFNGGSVIIRNTKVGREFNEMVLANRDMFENEQNFYNSMPMIVLGIDIMKPLPHPSINSYDYSCYPECKEYVGREDLGDWHPGNFVIHFPALSIENRIAMMQEYKDKIIYE